MMNQAVLRAIFNKTAGHCHFCGDVPLKVDPRRVPPP